MANFTIQSVTMSKAAIAPGEAVTATVRLTALQAVKTITFRLLGEMVNPNIGVSALSVMCAQATITKTMAANATATVSVNFTAYDADTALSLTDNTSAKLREWGYRATAGVYLAIQAFTSASGGASSRSPTGALVRAAASCSAIDRRCAPSIASYSAERATVSGDAGTPDDEGIRCMVSLRTALADETWISGMGCALTFGGNSVSVPVADAMAGITDDVALLAAYTFGAGDDHTITLTFGDAYERVTASAVLPEAFANVHLSGCGKGVAFGKFSSSTAAAPLFECGYKADFIGGVDADSLMKVISVSGSLTVSTGDPADGVDLPVSAGTGWTPIGIVGFYIANAATHPYRVYLTSGGDARIYARYYGTSAAAASVNVTLYVLCLHTG